MKFLVKIYEALVIWGETIYEYRNSKASKPQ